MTPRRCQLLRFVIVDLFVDVVVEIIGTIKGGCQVEIAFREHAPGTGGTNDGPDVLALLFVVEKPGTGAVYVELVALDPQRDVIELAALNLGLDRSVADLLDSAYAALRVVSVAARERPWRDQPAKRVFGEHGGGNERGPVAIPPGGSTGLLSLT